MALFWFSGNSNSASASTSVFGFLALLPMQRVTVSERFGVAARGGVSTDDDVATVSQASLSSRQSWNSGGGGTAADSSAPGS